MKMQLFRKILLYFCIALLCGCVFAFASSAEGTENVAAANAEELQAACNVAGARIVLTADITIAEPIDISVSGVTVDLSGFTIYADDSASSLFYLSAENLNFSVVGSGRLSVEREIFGYSNDADGAVLEFCGTGNGIIVTSSGENSNTCYFRVGNANGSVTATLYLGGKVMIMHRQLFSTFMIHKNSAMYVDKADICDGIHPSVDVSEFGEPAQTFYLYNYSKLTVTDSSIVNEHGSIFLGYATASYAIPTVTVQNSTLKALSATDSCSGSILASASARVSVDFINCKLEYTNSAFVETSKQYKKIITLTDTDTKYCGPSSFDAALFSGYVSATVSGGFHEISGAMFAVDTNELTSNGGLLVNANTAFSENPDGNGAFTVADNTALVNWYADSDTLFAVGYYTVGEIADFDISRLPAIIIEDGHYNLKYTAWRGDLTVNDSGELSFFPDETSLAPVASIDGIKYNLTTYTHFKMNVYVPVDVYVDGVYADEGCTNEILYTDAVIEDKNYRCYSQPFGVSELDDVTLYIKATIQYGGEEYTILQCIRVSLLEYVETILEGDGYSDTEKHLAADMLRYSNETVKLEQGEYDRRALLLMERYADNMTDISEYAFSDSERVTTEISEYIYSSTFLFGCCEPKFAFEYTDKFVNPSVLPTEDGMWLEISYISCDGAEKCFELILCTESKTFASVNIPVYDIDATLTLKIYSSDSDEPLAVGTYSLEGYIASLSAKGVDVTPAKALYAYSQSSEQYKLEKNDNDNIAE